MSTTIVSIAVSTPAGGAAAPGEPAAGPLGVFEAIMGAFFAGADGAVDDPKGGSPFAAEGAAEPARHNLDVAKPPAKAHPARAAAAVNGLASVGEGDGAAVPISAAAAELLAQGFAEPAAGAAAGAGQPLGEDEAAADGKPSTAEPSTPALPTDLAAVIAAQAPGAAPVEAVADPEAEAGPGPGAGAPAPAVGAPATMQDAASPPPLAAAEDDAATGVDKDEHPSAIPGAHASDTARLHASANSAVMRAASPPSSAEPAAQQAAAPPAAPSQTAPPQAAPPQPAAEGLVAPAAAAPVAEPPVADAAPAQPAASAASAALAAEVRGAPARKPGDKADRDPRVAAVVEPSPQTAAATLRGEAAPTPGAAPTDKGPELPADALRAPPAQADEARAPQVAAEPARAQAAAPAASPAAPEVRGSPETVASLSAQIVKKLGARSTHFDVQLDPAGLGKVNVRVAINADGQVSAAMRFDNPQAAAELRSRANELQRALAQSGFDLSGGLSFDVAQDQGGGHGGQQNAFMNDHDAGHAFRGRAFASALETAGDALQAALPVAFGEPRGAPKGVDVRI